MKHELYTISERSSNRLLINRKRSRFFFDFVALSLFFMAWIAGLFNIDKENGDVMEQIAKLIWNFSYWPFIAVSFYMLFQMGKSLYLFVIGDKIIIDKFEKTIIKNSGLVIGFSEIDFLQIRKYKDSDGDIDYRLSIVKSNGEKVFIDRASDRDSIIEFAEEVGDFISKEIKFK